MTVTESAAELATAPEGAQFVNLVVEAPAGTLELPIMWVAAEGSAGADDVIADVAAASSAFPVTIEVSETGAVVSGDGIAALREALSAGLGEQAGYDGDPASVTATIPEGVDEAAAGEATATGLLDPSGTLQTFAGGADEAEDEAPVEEVEETFATGTGEDQDPIVTVTEDGAWEGVLIVEGVPSGDNRMIEPEALSWRELPLALMAMFRNPEGGKGHDAAAIAGTIETIERRENGQIWGTGHLDMDGEVGQEAYRLMAKGMMRGVSADLDRVEVSWENELGDEAGLEDMLGFDPGTMLITSGRIMGATLCPFPAFEEAYVNLVDGAAEPIDDALVAAGGGAIEAQVWTPYGPQSLVASGALVSEIPVAPPAEWFARPTDEELAGLRAEGRAWRITDEGRVFGFAAVDGTVHIANRRATVPKSKNDYAYFRTGEVHCADGSIVATGPVCMDTVHPDLKLAASDAQTWYHHTGSVACDITVWDDKKAKGIVFAGALRPGVTPAQVRTLRASDGVSPDWRRIGGRLECVAMLVVNNSGFKIPALVASGGDELDEAGAYVMPGVFAARFAVASEEPLAMVAAGSFAARKPARDSAVVALAHQVAQLRTEMRDVQSVVRPMRMERARRLLGRMTNKID